MAINLMGEKSARGGGEEGGQMGCGEQDTNRRERTFPYRRIKRKITDRFWDDEETNVGKLGKRKGKTEGMSITKTFLRGRGNLRAKLVKQLNNWPVILQKLRSATSIVKPEGGGLGPLNEQKVRKLGKSTSAQCRKEGLKVGAIVLESHRGGKEKPTTKRGSLRGAKDSRRRPDMSRKTWILLGARGTLTSKRPLLVRWRKKNSKRME